MEKTNKTKNKKLGKVLVINDDTEDILALQAQMPKDIELFSASQFSAQCMPDHSYDLIILDNDANDLKESKGKKTLEEIKSKNPDAQVIYTSFQPGWVPAEVYQTKGVSVVKTDQLPEFLAQTFGIKLVPVEKKDKTPSKTNIILTYNPVSGYSPGIHGDGKLLIVSYPKNASELAKQVMQQHLESLYHQFDWKTDKGLVRNIFVYDGINGKEVPGQAAASLGHDLRMKIHLMACGCDWERKLKFANQMYVDLHEVECGGRESLGAIADVILGIKRPGINYNKLAIPLEVILSESKKFN